MGGHCFGTVWDEHLERNDGMPFLSWNQRSWFWSRDTVPSVNLLFETRSRRTYRHLSLCRSFGNKFFWSISLWVNYPTISVCVHVLIVVEELLPGILIWQSGVFFSLSKAFQQSAWRPLHTFFSQTPQTGRAS